MGDKEEWVQLAECFPQHDGEARGGYGVHRVLKRSEAVRIGEVADQERDGFPERADRVSAVDT
ncbi:hypothetical protein GCM10022254_16610 [Actinomadura meridiana]|uniref:Transposase n=1 Tax=Actinomadura meridiana TaxID=559626 RepID=A0ABP8BVU6_9ACTN